MLASKDRGVGTPGQELKEIEELIKTRKRERKIVSKRVSKRERKIASKRVNKKERKIASKRVSKVKFNGQ